VSQKTPYHTVDRELRSASQQNRRLTSERGHFRPINDVCATSAFHRIATKLLHYSK
jgi:hypothetical protein